MVALLKEAQQAFLFLAAFICEEAAEMRSLLESGLLKGDDEIRHGPKGKRRR